MHNKCIVLKFVVAKLQVIQYVWSELREMSISRPLIGQLSSFHFPLVVGVTSSLRVGFGPRTIQRSNAELQQRFFKDFSVGLDKEFIINV